MFTSPSSTPDPICSVPSPASSPIETVVRPPGRWRLLIVGLAVVALAAACGSSSKTATADATATTTNARSGYRDCLAQNGVTLPDRGTGGPNGTGNANGGGGGTGGGGAGGGFGAGGGTFGGGTIPGVDPATLSKAQDACKSLRPQGGAGGGAGGTAFAAYASCMTDHGITITTRNAGDPSASSTSSTASTTPPTSIDRSSPQFQAANDACKALLPAGAAGGPGGASGDSTTTTAAP